MLCSPCKYAADTGDQAAHEICKGCSCQHHPPGYGQTEPDESVLNARAAEDKRVRREIEQIKDGLAAMELDEARQAALDSTGMTLDELVAAEKNWSLDAWGLKVLGIIRGQAA